MLCRGRKTRVRRKVTGARLPRQSRHLSKMLRREAGTPQRARIEQQVLRSNATPISTAP
jgi:hypothetical protein